MNKRWTIKTIDCYDSNNHNNILTNDYVYRCLKKTKLDCYFDFNVKHSDSYETRPWLNDMWPWPENPYEVVIFTKGTIPGCLFSDDTKYIVGGADINGKRCSVTFSYIDSQIEIGARIIHEILHTYDLDADGMTSREYSNFIIWLSKNNKKHLRFVSDPNAYYNDWHYLGQELLCEYYRYLIETNLQISWWTKLLCKIMRWF